MTYTTVRAAPADAEQLRSLARQLAAAADLTVTQAVALSVAVTFALDHVPEVAALLRRAEVVSGSE